MDYKEVRIPWEGWYVIDKIGKGGFGAVYEIERSQYGIQERAAMKVITIPQSADEIDDLLIEGYDNNSITQRFDAFAEDIVREYGMMAQMKGNANIVYCDDYRIIQQDNGFGRDIYIRMELLTPLLKAMDRVSSESQIIRFGMEMCNALEACQKRKVIHRDIKPQNIFVSDDGVFKLGDFGIARKAEKTTRATVGKGTYQFMAPEVKNELPYGPTVDIYSLGLVMYWLLNNRRGPFFPLPPAVPTHSEEQEALRRRFAGEKIPAPQNGSKGLKQIILKACAFEPKERYQTAREMREDLVRLSGSYAADYIPETKSAPIQNIQDDVDDNKTVGPVFNRQTTAEELERTIGPQFSKKAQKKSDESKPKGGCGWNSCCLYAFFFVFEFIAIIYSGRVFGLIPALHIIACGLVILAVSLQLVKCDKRNKWPVMIFLMTAFAYLVWRSASRGGWALQNYLLCALHVVIAGMLPLGRKKSTKRKLVSYYNPGRKKWQIVLLIAIALILCVSVLCSNMEEHIHRIITGNIMIAGNNYFNSRETVKKINSFWISLIGATRDEQGIIWEQSGNDLNPSCSNSNLQNACALLIPTTTMLFVSFALCVILLVQLIRKYKTDYMLQKNANKTTNLTIALLMVYFAAYLIFGYFSFSYVMWTD